MGFLRNGRLLAALVAGVLVIGVVIGAVSALGGGDGGDGTSPSEPEALSLTRTSAGLEGVTGLVLGGDLSEDAVEGVVLDPSGSSVTADEVAELLAALGMNAQPEQADGGWVARGPARGEPAAFALDETTGNVWQFATGDDVDCLSVVPGGRPEDSVSCAAADDVTGDGPGRAATLRAADDVFDVVGVRPGKGLRALNGGGTTTIDVPLEVEDLPVVGVTLSVSADENGLDSAVGWLRPDLRPLGAYPLVTAQEAFDLLADEPRPEPELCALPTDAQGDPIPDGPCETPSPTTVTAARLAWLPSFDGTRTLLVPAWQFEADGFYGPTRVALTEENLRPPS
jgi:hypothetical protein